VRVDRVDRASHTGTWIKEESGREDGQDGLEEWYWLPMAYSRRMAFLRGWVLSVI
jgi:hypothetical protein